MKNNIILTTDSYKVTHWKQYEEETQKVFSYFESRQGAKFDGTLVFGLQALLKKYLLGQVVTEEKIDEAEELFALHFGNKDLFNRKGWEHILRKHGGQLPVIIRAVPEGSLIPTSNVILTLENTDIEVPWLTNYLETLLVQLWYPSTVATQSFFIKRIIASYLEKTGGIEGLDFKLHDFGFRGSTSVESAGLGGLAHLVNFKGTDTMEALVYGRQYYNCSMAGFSIPASEHSTITTWGRDHETDAFRNMLQQFPTGLVAVVSDSYDIYKACSEKWGKELKQEVLERDGVLVVRPDSGDPATTVLKVLNLLGDAFGYTTNEQGYKVLDPHVRVIQGDGVNITSIDEILHNITKAGWSAANVAFGSGGALLQKLDRDTQKFAFKCSSVIVDAIARDVYKDPVGDKGKKSKRGRLALVKNADSQLMTVPEASLVPGQENLLRTVFYNGELMIDETLETIRARAMENFKAYGKELITK